MPDLKTAELLKQMRIDSGYTQAQLSEKMGTVQSNISRAEKIGCSFEFLKRAANICGCEINIKIS